MNNGNYYKLVGNTSTVKVNWEKDCGGGGGGGTAGVSSLDGQTGALTTKTINGNAILGTGDIVISGAGGDTTVIDFDTMSQAELAALFTEIYAKWSGSSINGEYTFLKSFGDYTPENQGTRQMRLQFITAEGDSTLDFGTATYNPYDGNRVITWYFRLYSDGTYLVQTGGVRGVDKDMSNVGYFDSWNEALSFNKTTSAFTHYNGETTETITDGASFGGSFYWFIINAPAGSWGLGVPLLLFDVTDESGVTTTYQYPSISKQSTSVTIGDITYDIRATFDYGDIIFEMLMNDQPKGAQFQVKYRGGDSGGDSNYVIVDALSAITNPVEGMIAYVPAHNETYSGYTISNADGNLYGQVFVKQYNPREKSYMLYEQYDEGMMSFPNSSPWELGNSGIFKYAFRNQLAISYSDNDKEFVVLYKPGRFQMQIGVSQEYYSETTGTVQVPGQMYIYKYGSWHYYEDGKISYYLSTITEAEYDALYADVPTMGMSEVQFIVDDFYAGWAEYKLATITTQPSSNSVYGSGFSCGASNGETFDAINALSVRCEWSSGWKDWNLIKYSLLPTP